MDIVVTLSPNDYYRFEKELDNIKSHGYVWYIWSTPRKLKVGNRAYIIKQNTLLASMKVVSINENSDYQDATTQREFAAKCLVHLTDYQEEKPLKIKGFSGFRYKRW